MSDTRRNQIITDQVVQGELMFRAIVYWFFCLLVVELLVLGWSIVTGPVGRPIQQVVRESLAISAPAIFGSVLLLPLVLLDVIRVSNRFVGPIQSVRCTLQQLANGEPARRVYLRRNDFWQELAHYTNVVADRLETEEFDAETDAQDLAEFGSVAFVSEDGAEACLEELGEALEEGSAPSETEEGQDVDKTEAVEV